MPADLVLHALFWTLVLLVLQPFRTGLSLVAFIGLANLDMSAAATGAPDTIGWLNALKSIVLTAYLLARGLWLLERLAPGRPREILRQVARSRSFWLWGALTAYAALTLFRSSYQLSAAKLVAALLSHLMVFAAALCYWQSGRLTPRVLAAGIGLMLALGGVQSWLLPGVLQTPVNVFYDRFTSFSAPQSYAEGLVALAAVLLWHPNAGGAAKLTGAGALLGVLALNGSRLATLAALAALASWLVRRFDRSRATVGLGLAAALLAVLAIEPARAFLSGGRLGEARSILEQGLLGADQVSTFEWRLGLYDCVWTELGARRGGELLWGSGTASSAELDIVCSAEQIERFHPTRVLHSEFLRAAWDWGLVGALLAAALALSLLWSAGGGWLAAGRGRGEPEGLGALAGAAPVILLAASFENILQAAGAPGPVAFALVIAHHVHLRLERRARSGSYDRPSSHGLEQPRRVSGSRRQREGER